MRRLLLLALILVFASGVQAGDAFTGRVVSIADGDTLTVLDQDRHQHNIRLAEIDATATSGALRAVAGAAA